MLSNPKWEAFAVAYAQHGNGTRAAIEAGYSAGENNGGAAVRASTLLKKPEVAKRIEQIRQTLKRKATASAGVDRAWVLDKLRENAEEALGRGDRAAANRALELLGREHGLFIERKMVVYGPLDALTAPQLARLLGLAEAIEQGRLALPSNGLANTTASSEGVDIIEGSALSTQEPVPIEVLDAVEEAEDDEIDPLG